MLYSMIFRAMPQEEEGAEEIRLQQQLWCGLCQSFHSIDLHHLLPQLGIVSDITADLLPQVDCQSSITNNGQKASVIVVCEIQTRLSLSRDTHCTRGMKTAQTAMTRM
jgi:hypothetical protein